MADTALHTFIAGLKDAYAMEKQSADMLKSQARRLKDYPEMQARAEQHAKETQQQIERLEKCLKLLDQSPSRFKDFATRTVGMVQSLVVGMTSDEIIKDSLASYTFEHLEIAAYRNLIVMAEALSHPAVAVLCRESLEEERAMVRWLDERMESTARDFIARHTRAAA